MKSGQILGTWWHSAVQSVFWFWLINTAWILGTHTSGVQYWDSPAHVVSLLGIDHGTVRRTQITCGTISAYDADKIKTKVVKIPTLYLHLQRGCGWLTQHVTGTHIMAHANLLDATTVRCEQNSNSKSISLIQYSDWSQIASSIGRPAGRRTSALGQDWFTVGQFKWWEYGYRFLDVNVLSLYVFFLDLDTKAFAIEAL